MLRYAAFTDTPSGGNPAGVVLAAGAMSDAAMLAIAAEVGYSETAFLTARAAPSAGAQAFDVRYFSPAVEVPFCGHATVAAAVALAKRDGPGPLLFHTPAGDVPVDTWIDADGNTDATLTSIPPRVEDVSREDVASALLMLRWQANDLDPGLPPRYAYAGARHLILAAATRKRLANLEYDFEGLRSFMEVRDLVTVDLIWRESADVFHARNPFPVGGIVEDPATGAAAAALGAYLRELGVAIPPARITVLQGEDMGRPSRLLVELDAGRAEVRVTGRAVAIEGGDEPE